jgi:CBS domain-containing protein
MNMKQRITASEIMVDTVVTLKPDMSLKDAWQVLFENKISGAPVVNYEGHLLGVLSQTDLVREAFADGFSDFPKNSYYFGIPYYDEFNIAEMSDKMSTIAVEEVMTPDPICAKESRKQGCKTTTMRLRR